MFLDFEFVKELKTWTDARKYCQAIGRDLVRFESKEEQNKVAAMAITKTVGGWWIGLREKKDEKWIWVNGREVSWTTWKYPTQPNGVLECVYLYGDDATWLTRSCSVVYPFICRIIKDD